MNNLADKIRDSEKAIAESRENWQKKTKPLIIESLELIKDELQLGLHVAVNDSTVNHESIYMSFGKTPSGLIYKKGDIFNEQEGRKGLIMKDGANLFYSIGFRGEVTVWMQYPQIENILWKENDYNEMRIVDQDKINEESIRLDVKHFLEQVLKWNSGGIMNERVGFKQQGIE